MRKLCRGCLKWKDLEEFYKQRYSKQCRECSWRKYLRVYFSMTGKRYICRGCGITFTRQHTARKHFEKGC